MNQVKSQMIMEVVRQHILKRYISDSVSTFYIYRTDTNQILARGVTGFDNAKEVANRLRKQYRLQWDKVSFKKERNKSSHQPQKRYPKSGGGIYRYQTAKGHWKDWDE